MKRTLIFLVLGTVFSGCVSTTRIYTDPPGAKVALDSRPMGVSPIELNEDVWLWTNHIVTVEKDGYAMQTLRLKNEGANAAGIVACVCTAGILFPFLLTSSYQPQYFVELVPEGTDAESKPITSAATIDFK